MDSPHANQYKDYGYPILNLVVKKYVEPNLRDVALVACLDLRAPELKMLDLLRSSGLDPQQCVIIGRKYSAHPFIQEILDLQGFVTAPFALEFCANEPFESWYTKKVQGLVNGLNSHIDWSLKRKVILVDDGGFIHCAFAENKKLRDCYSDDIFVGIERSTFGATKIESGHIKACEHFLSAAQNEEYPGEAFYHAREAVNRIIAHIEQRRFKDPVILVDGLNPVGRQVAYELFVRRGFRGVVTDHKYCISGTNPYIDPTCRLLSERRMIVDHQAVFSHLKQYHVIVGASGFMTINPHQVGLLHPRASLINVSDCGDRQFWVQPFRNIGNAAHDDCYREGRCLVNAGHPIIARGALHEMHPRYSELGVARLLSSILDLATADHDDPFRPKRSEVMKDAHEMWRKQIE